MTPAEFFRTLYAHRRFIVSHTIAVAVLCAIISLVLPKWYLGRASLLPPEENQSDLGIMSAMLAQSPVLASFALTGTPSEILVRILESRTIRERVITTLDLFDEWEMKEMETTVKRLRRVTRMSVSPEGVVYIGVLDKDPELSAAIANAYLDALDEFNREKRVGRARRTREFVENRVAETKEQLARAEEELRGFEETYSSVELPEQTKAAIETASEILAQIVDREVRLGVLREDLSESHPTVIQLRNESAGLRAQLDRILESGTEEDSSSLYVPLEQIPEIKMEMLRQARELEILNRKYGLLVEQYEQALIQEERDVESVQVLDRAVVPVRKEKPRRALITLAGGAFAFLCATMLSFAAERGRGPGSPPSGRSPGLSEEYAALRRYFREALGETSPSRRDDRSS